VVRDGVGGEASFEEPITVSFSPPYRACRCKPEGDSKGKCNGNVFVVDRAGALVRRIHMFNGVNTVTTLKTVSADTLSPFEFKEPYGICVDHSVPFEHVLVTDCHRVCELSRTDAQDVYLVNILAGKTAYGHRDGRGIDDSLFHYPTGLCVYDTMPAGLKEAVQRSAKLALTEKQSNGERVILLTDFTNNRVRALCMSSHVAQTVMNGL